MGNTLSPNPKSYKPRRPLIERFRGKVIVRDDELALETDAMPFVDEVFRLFADRSLLYGQFVVTDRLGVSRLRAGDYHAPCGWTVATFGVEMHGWLTERTAKRMFS